MVTSAEMKAIEKAADEAGLTYYQMMENAGTAAFNEIMARYPVAEKNLLILCGKGNNGGDGYVAARRLFGFGGNVTLAFIDGTPISTESMVNFDLCKEIGLPMITKADEIVPAIKDAHIIVDALYGTGFRGELRRNALYLIEAVNKSKATRVSLDLPSGLSGDNDRSSVGPHISANLTIAFHDKKPIHNNPLAHLGEVLVASIGIENCLSQSQISSSTTGQ